MTSKTRIVLADDHPVVLNGLRNLIQAVPDLELVGEAGNGSAALKLIRDQRPDVAIIDISMPDLNGVMLCRQLTKEMPSVGILVLTLHEDRAYLKQALDAGARGYALKRSAAETLVHAIKAVHVGGLYVDPAIANRFFHTKPAQGRRHKRDDEGHPSLTERETDVLKLVALGFTNKEIARRLDVGIKSIATYRLRGSEKLGVKTRAELVRYASGQGWLSDA